MDIKFVGIDSSNIGDFVPLYLAVFNAPPWNDGWTEAAAAERLESFSRISSFRGAGYLVDGAPGALVLGWGERWVNAWHFCIREMCVATTLQGQRIGTTLLADFERQLSLAGFAAVVLETGRSAPARKFYETLGYGDIGLIALGKSLPGV